MGSPAKVGSAGVLRWSVQLEDPSDQSGVVTFLFTDIEGSTRRWEADAEAMRGALEAHDDVLRHTIAGSGGDVFKHTGDGLCAAFVIAASALDAAIAAQRSLELPVRMGIATGEAERRDGDYFGAALNRAARVMAAGHGGQILLDGLYGVCSATSTSNRLGPRRLRDIVSRQHLSGPGRRLAQRVPASEDRRPDAGESARPTHRA